MKKHKNIERKNLMFVLSYILIFDERPNQSVILNLKKMGSNNFYESLLSDNVGTKYGDLSGLVQIDGHENIMGIYTLCRDYGIDLDNYFLIGFGLSNSSELRGEQLTGICTILVLEKEKYGDTFDDIQRNIKGLSCVDVIKKSFSVEYDKLGKYIKRFDFLSMTSLANFVGSINLKDE